MKKQRPIIFSTDMVRAIMDGRKSETRRVVKPQPDYVKDKQALMIPTGYDYVNGKNTTGKPWPLKCPYGKPGDILYVRESFTIGHDEYLFKSGDESDEFFKWKPSIHMPKKAARIWLEIQDILVERVQDINDEGAIREGVKPDKRENFHNYKFPNTPLVWAKSSFESLWWKIHGIESWEQNPYVWVLKFKVLSTNGKPSNI